MKEEEIAHLVNQKRTRLYTRRIWFLYEWLLGRERNLLAECPYRSSTCRARTISGFREADF
ncbi:hypothetical protein EAS62_36830 [Bradyrhizobium zhanjiangense]|uniref:Uncharacterized protein n=1 Tax=Bradyrhizobium zhanjiangense TaxID=1325107 RepID=A0ABY0D9H2_9BRAD|nr:hypothetical protein EAS62_36830 [Bradyrhizobium zhanjiangense]